MRILLADDHALFRSGMRYILAELGPAVEIIEVGNRHEAIEQLRQSPFDLVLTDLLMPGMAPDDGAAGAAVADLRSISGSAPVVVISMLDSPAEIRAAVAAGANGYIPKSSTPEIMIKAVKLVLAGGVYLPPSILALGEALPPAQLRPALPAATAKGLTLRQKAVLTELVRGKSNKEIALSLKLSEATVKVHLAAIMRTFNVRSRTQVILAATQQGLIHPDS